MTEFWKARGSYYKHSKYYTGPLESLLAHQESVNRDFYVSDDMTFSTWMKRTAKEGRTVYFTKAMKLFSDNSSCLELVTLALLI